MSNDLRRNLEERDDELLYETSSISGHSDAESCSSDLGDDAPSDQNQPSDFRKLDASGPLDNLSSLMAELPNPKKRGLSNYYDGKSQSFTSLSDVKCVEDLPKKVKSYKRKIKACKSYADGLSDKIQDAICNNTPNNKNISRGSCGNHWAGNNSKNLFYRPPPIPLNKKSSKLP